jgi:hypothetical protein
MIDFLDSTMGEPPYTLTADMVSFARERNLLVLPSSAYAARLAASMDDIKRAIAENYPAKRISSSGTLESHISRPSPGGTAPDFRIYVLHALDDESVPVWDAVELFKQFSVCEKADRGLSAHICVTQQGGHRFSDPPRLDLILQSCDEAFS